MPCVLEVLSRSGLDRRAAARLHTLNFGVLERRYKTPATSEARGQSFRPGIADFSNLDKHGNMCSPRTGCRFFKLGDRRSGIPDGSFRPVPSLYSLLSGHHIIPLWGLTLRPRRDMRAASDALDRTAPGRPSPRDSRICPIFLIYLARGDRSLSDLLPEEIARSSRVRRHTWCTRIFTGHKSLFLMPRTPAQRHRLDGARGQEGVPGAA